MDRDSRDNRFMDYLLFRSLKGQATAAEEEKMLGWRRASPENEAYAQRLSRLLAMTSLAYGGSHGGVGEPPDAAELVRIAESTAGASGGTSDDRVGGSRSGRRVWRRLGALGVVAGGLAAVLMIRAGGPVPPKVEDRPGFGVEEFITGSTDATTVQLSDGTVVRLAPESRLKLTGRGGREVVLEGRAYFAVARMPGNPFTVRTRGGDAVALGTQFEAEARDNELRVLVVEGRVALAAAGNSVELGAGEMARAVGGALSAPTSVSDPWRLLEWTGDFLVFQGTPVDEVAAEVERHFGMSVRVVGDKLAEQTVTAWFADATAEDVLRVVCKVLGAECSIDARGALIDLTRVEASRREAP